jgi:hypothetical protein
MYISAPSLFGGYAFPAFFDAFLMALDNESETGAPVKRTPRMTASQKWCGGSFFALRAGSLHPLEILSCCRCFAASALPPAVISLGVIVLPWALSAVPPVGPLTCALSMVAASATPTDHKPSGTVTSSFRRTTFKGLFLQRLFVSGNNSSKDEVSSALKRYLALSQDASSTAAWPNRFWHSLVMTASGCYVTYRLVKVVARRKAILP